jgi:hypothetical protein
MIMSAIVPGMVNLNNAALIFCRFPEEYDPILSDEKEKIKKEALETIKHLHMDPSSLESPKGKKVYSSLCSLKNPSFIEKNEEMVGLLVDNKICIVRSNGSFHTILASPPKNKKGLVKMHGVSKKIGELWVNPKLFHNNCSKPFPIDSKDEKLLNDLKNHVTHLFERLANADLENQNSSNEWENLKLLDLFESPNNIVTFNDLKSLTIKTLELGLLKTGKIYRLVQAKDPKLWFYIAATIACLWFGLKYIATSE